MINQRRPSDGGPSIPKEEAGAEAATVDGAWRTWLAVGATGFGGPAGQVAILHREVVERKRWLTEEEFLAALRVCMLLPGPEAQQLATYAGWRLGGTTGGLVAGTLFVLPGALLVTALAWLHAAGRDVPFVAAAFVGVRPAVVALVALAAWRIGRKSIGSPLVAALAIAAGVALARGAPFPAVVAVCGALGWLAPTGRTEASAPGAPLPRGDAVRHGMVVVAVAGAIWAACYGIVRLAGAAGGRAPAIAMLFTETTLLSLGGAYAVVPWALDESLARGWLDGAERFAALAMGEATPGPLILVVTFIGFLAGWKAEPASAVAAGLEGAATATVFAFIPSFAMILALAPAVRSIRTGSRLAGALTAVGAAVVATIAILAAKLARDAFVADGTIDVVTVVICGLAAAALTGAKIPTPLVVLAAAALGVLRATL
ncbi:MAG: chromate efflux transporter [Planctomycetaceae bacterium]